MKLLASIKKEYLILIRDKAGLALLFIMPLILVILITSIQDNTYKAIKESSIELLFLNSDNDSLGNSVEKGIEESKIFHITKLKNEKNSIKYIKESVSKGKYQIGIIISENTTQKLRKNIRSKIISSLKNKELDKQNYNLLNVQIYLDPATKLSFKQTVISAIKDFSSKLESKFMFSMFFEEVSKMFPISIPDNLNNDEEFLRISTDYPSISKNEILPNSVQHNVPAWTLFAIFFIVIPLSGNMIKERDEGSGLRLRTMPVSYTVILTAKIVIYLVVCLLQFSLLFISGMYLLPQFGLPGLQMNVDILALIFIVLTSGLAASGFAVFIGTISVTTEQAAIAGSVSVMIFAAIGGVWVPTYVMPDIMKSISIISPLNWGLEGFYDVFLRGGNLLTIWKYSILLLGFFILMLSISIIYDKKYR